MTKTGSARTHKQKHSFGNKNIKCSQENIYQAIGDGHNKSCTKIENASEPGSKKLDSGSHGSCKIISQSPTDPVPAEASHCCSGPMTVLQGSQQDPQSVACPKPKRQRIVEETAATDIRK